MNKKEDIQDEPVKASSFGRVIKQKRIEDLGAEEESPVKKKSKPVNITPVISHKEKWKPEDDMKLLEAMQTYGDYEKIERLVSFSVKASAKDIEDNWVRMLYSQKESSDGDKRAPWSQDEEAILLREGGSETFTGFHTILDQFASHFHSSRTARGLEAHYFRLKRNSVSKLPTVAGQQPNNVSPSKQQTSRPGTPPSIPVAIPSTTSTTTSDSTTTSNISPPSAAHSVNSINSINGIAGSGLEGCLQLEPDLAEPSPALDYVEARLKSTHPASEEDTPKECTSPMQHANRQREYGRIEKLAQREILKVEKEYARDRDSLRERDTKMLAIVRGKRIRFSMRTKEAVIGRGSLQEPVDINITEEGSSHPNRCSRKHAIIKMKRDGEFYIKNIGKHVIYVNEHEVPTGKKKLLYDNCLIRMSDIYLIFEMNKSSQNKIKRQLQM